MAKKNDSRETVVIPETPTRTRKPREKSVFTLEKSTVDGGSGWTDAVPGQTFTDTRDALAFIQEREMDGEFRVVVVKKVVKATKVQKTVINVE